MNDMFMLLVLCCEGTLTVKELENQQLELLRLVDSPQPPTTEPPTDVVRPHVLKLDQLDELDNGKLQNCYMKNCGIFINLELRIFYKPSVRPIIRRDNLLTNPRI